MLQGDRPAVLPDTAGSTMAGLAGGCSEAARHVVVATPHLDLDGRASAPAGRRDGHPVPRPAARSRQVDDHGTPRGTRRSPGSARRSAPHARHRSGRWPRPAAGTSRSITARVCSGVWSAGFSPVPPVVITTAYAAVTAARRARPTASPSGTTTGPLDREAQLAQRLDDHRSGAVRVPAGGRPGRDGDHQGGVLRPFRVQSPGPPAGLGEHPYVAEHRGRSIALIMSMTRGRPRSPRSAPPSPPRCGRWSRRSPRSPRRRRSPRHVTSTALMANGWQSGIRSGVFLAAWIPAIRATASASPLGSVPERSAATASGLSRTIPAAVAERPRRLSLTSTIRASPRSFRCGRDVSAIAGVSPAALRAARPRPARRPRRTPRLLGQDDQGVGPGQVAQQVRAVAPGQRDLPPPGLGVADHAAGQLLPAPDRRHRVRRLRPDRRSARTAARPSACGSPAGRTPRRRRTSSPGCPAA